MRPLDLVRTKKGDIGLITEVKSYKAVSGKIVWSASIEFLKCFDEPKTAWWDEDEIEIIDNLPNLLSRELAHPIGTGSHQPY